MALPSLFGMTGEATTGSRLNRTEWTVLSRLGDGDSVLLSRDPVVASPVIPNKDGRATDSCFALVGAHQCCVLLEVMG